MPTYTLDTTTGTVTVNGTSSIGVTADVDVVTDTPETFQEEDGECGNLDTAAGADLNTAARECAARRGWAMEDGSFPIRPGEHASTDLNNAIRAVGRARPNTEARRAAVRRHIMGRARSVGLTEEIPDTWNRDGSIDKNSSASVDPNHWSNYTNTPSPTYETLQTFQDQEDCPEGQVRNDEGECVERDSDGDDDVTPGYQAASPPAKPPAWVFANPNLNRATPLTVDDNGYVYGHLATWGECHTGVGNKCVVAPRSKTGYAYFTTGEVVCEDGSRQAVGKITLGCGHADPNLGFVPSVQHYDNSGAVVAVVAPYEDRFGIVVAGSLVPGLNEERLAELRRSPLSGDWRRIGGNLELVAALAVNSPGFPVIRASAFEDDELEVLLAAGVVSEPGDVDLDEDRARRWKRIEDIVRSERVKELLGD